MIDDVGARNLPSTAFSGVQLRGLAAMHQSMVAVSSQGDIEVMVIDNTLPYACGPGPSGAFIDWSAGVTAALGSYRDDIRGGDSDDILRGEAGDDTIFGDHGDDTIWGEGDAAAFVLAEAAFNLSAVLANESVGGVATRLVSNKRKLPPGSKRSIRQRLVPTRCRATSTTTRSKAAPVTTCSPAAPTTTTSSATPVPDGSTAGPTGVPVMQTAASSTTARCCCSYLPLRWSVELPSLVQTFRHEKADNVAARSHRIRSDLRSASMHAVRKFLVIFSAIMMVSVPLFARPAGAAEVNVIAEPSIGSGCDIEFRFEVLPPGTVSFAPGIVGAELGNMGDTAPDPDALGPGTYSVSIDGAETGGDGVETEVTLLVDGVVITIPVSVPPCPDPESIDRENMFEESLREGTWVSVLPGVVVATGGGDNSDDNGGDGGGGDSLPPCVEEDAVYPCVAPDGCTYSEPGFGMCPVLPGGGLTP